MLLPIAYGDFETYSEAGYVWNDDIQRWRPLPGATKAGLSAIGLARYAEHRSTVPLMLSYKLPGAETVCWDARNAIEPFSLFDHIEAGGLFSAWNVSFEWHIWNKICVPRWGWPELPLRQCRCTMGRARAHALPGSLEAAGDVLGIDLRKDKDGSRLMKIFSMPRNPTKNDARRRVMPDDDPTQFEAYKRYNIRDVDAEYEIAQRIPELSPDELEYWMCDFEMNARGVAVDMPGVENCISVVEGVLERCDARICALTNGVVEKTSQLERMKGWLNSRGVHTASLDENALDTLLASELPPDVREVLEQRAAAGSASVKKVFAIRNQVTTAGRLHNMWMYHGARTGRPTGAGVQPTNLVKSGPPVYQCAACNQYYGTHTVRCPWCAAVRSPTAKPVEWCVGAAECALRVVSARSAPLLDMYFGHALHAVAGCLRALFVAGEGYELVSSDYNSIEAVVAACLAGEQWRIDVFRGHGRIYEVSAARITGIPFDESMVHPHRKLGKVAELASCYGGWINSWLNFGAGDFMAEEEIKDAVLAWRAASPAIVHIWKAGEQAAHGAVMTPGLAFHVMRLDGTHSGLTYHCADDVLYCTLPSGRPLSYHRPRLTPIEWYGKPKLELSFEGWNTDQKIGPVGWMRLKTRGAKLFENNCQAVAGDVQRHAIVTCERNSYPVVMQIYDELVNELPKGSGTVERLEGFMATLPTWCADWPIRASGGWIGQRYRKG